LGGSDEQDFWNHARDSLFSGPLQSGNGASRRSEAAECPGYETGAASFERTSGHKLTNAYNSAGAVTKRIQSAEAADVVIKWHTFPVAVSRKVRPYPQPDVINPKGASLADTRAEQTSFGTY